MNLRPSFFAAFALLISAAAIAHDYNIGNIYIDHPYARATVPGQPSGAAYLTLENKGSHADALISVTSPIAQSVEIHTMSMSGNVMRMREVDSIELKPKEKVVMLPGDGYHLMLTGLKAPLKAGDKLPLILTFKKAGKVETSIRVEDGNAKNEANLAEQHQH